MNPKFDSDNPYHVLGVRTKSSLGVCKQAFRMLTKEFHPDKGGDEETWKKIQEAWDIIKDPKKKAHYDSTGSRPVKPKNIDIQSQGLILDLFGAWSDKAVERVMNGGNDEIFNFNVLEMIQEIIEERLAGHREALKKTEKVIKGYNKIKKKSGGLFSELIDGRIAKFKEVQDHNLSEIKISVQALEMLDDGSWTYDYVEPEPDPVLRNAIEVAMNNRTSSNGWFEFKL
jgi:curved DNA-binding protein CbpA